MNSPTDHDMIEKLIVLLEHLGREEDYPDTEESELDQVLARCMKRFVDRMPGGFFAYRADEKEEIIYANQAMVRLLGCETLEEFRAQTGNSFRGLVHPQDLESVENSIREQIAHSSFDLDYVEYRIITRDGQIRWIDDYGHFIRGKTVGDVFYVFAGDATEKKNRLREEQEFFLEEKRRREGVLQAKLKEYDQELEKDRQEQLRRLEVIEGLSVDYESIFYINLEQDSVKAYRLSSRFKAQFPEEAPVRVFTGFDSRYIREWVYPEDRGLLEGVSTREFLQQKLAGDRTFYVNYRVLKDGNRDFMECLELMKLWYRDVMVFKATQDANVLIFIHELTAIRETANYSSFHGIDTVIDAIDKARIRLNANVGFDLVMELLLLTIKEL